MKTMSVPYYCASVAILSFVYTACFIVLVWIIQGVAENVPGQKLQFLGTDLMF